MPESLGEELLIIQKEFDGFDETREQVDKLLLERVSLRGICRTVCVLMPWLLQYIKKSGDATGTVQENHITCILEFIIHYNKNIAPKLASSLHA